MLSQQKKIGIVLKLSGFALLLSILLGIPLGWSKGTLIAIGVIGAALVLCALPLMWKDGIANLKNRAITDEDATPKGFDGIRRVALGELTFEFRNIRQRVCRISNLAKSAAALQALRG